MPICRYSSPTKYGFEEEDKKEPTCKRTVFEIIEDVLKRYVSEKVVIVAFVKFAFTYIQQEFSDHTSNVSYKLDMFNNIVGKAYIA